jgi:hypothetical protein
MVIQDITCSTAATCEKVMIKASPVSQIFVAFSLSRNAIIDEFCGG